VTPETITIAERIWPEWRKRASEEHEWRLQLLFSPAVDGAAAEDALRDALHEVADSLDAEAKRTDDPDPPFAGEWSAARVTGGVAVHVTESEVFERALRALAAGLERRGLTGTIDLWEQAPGVTPPTRAAMLACRVRVRGRRVRRGERHYEWTADHDAFDALVAAADRWCRTGPAGAAHSLTLGTAGTFAVARAEDVLERVSGAVAGGTPATVTTAERDSFRSLNADVTGALTLVAGGDAIEHGGWRDALQAMAHLLRDQAGQVAYAYAFRGWAVASALAGEPLVEDWPERPGGNPVGAGWTNGAFEDLYAPDAFGVQLLGPGYTSRVPTELDAWRVEPIRDSVLLEHADPDAWFAAPFVPFGRFGGPEPDVLRAARADLAPILYRRGILAEEGFADMAGA
jgi:hypothetical protein